MERRFSTHRVSVETRDDGKPVIVGYAAVFYRAADRGTEFPLFEGIVERVARTAFDQIDKDDVRALYNHDPRAVLGRVRAGTMRLSVDDVGLRYEIDPPDTQVGRDTLESIRRGDVDGSSFGFNPRGSKGIGWETNPDGTGVRWLRSLSVFDVGPVTYPAYQATSAGVRSVGDTSSVVAEWRSHQDQQAKAARRRQLLEKYSR